MSDVIVRPNGSIILFTPDTDAGRHWISENVQSESWQWLGRSLAVDARMAVPIYEDMRASGLEVEVV